MASFQILSDLHLENPTGYNLFDVVAQAPYLALLGDIGNVRDDGFFAFLEAQLPKFQIVFLLLGNHEPYYSSWPAVREKLQKFSDSVHHRRAQASSSGSSKLGQFVFLDRTRYDISQELTVLGCTLFSRVCPTQEEQVSFRLNDFYDIQDWTVENHCAAHEVDRAWLNDQVSRIAQEDPHRKIVVFTHQSPTIAAEAVDPKHAHSPITSAFATDLRGEPCWEKPQVRLWAFGHTHFNCDFTESRTGKRVVTNQRGYYFAQSPGFDLKRTIRV